MTGRLGAIITSVCLLLVLSLGPGWARDRAPSLRQLKQAVKENPQDPQAYYNLGLQYAILGKDKEAVKAFKQALKLKPDYAEAYRRLGSALSKERRLDEAIGWTEKALAIDPVV